MYAYKHTPQNTHCQVWGTYQIGMRVKHLRDTLTSKSLLPEPSLDIIEDLGMRWIRLVQDILQPEICRTEAVAEMLSEDPPAV